MKNDKRRVDYRNRVLLCHPRASCEPLDRKGERWWQVVLEPGKKPWPVVPFAVDRGANIAWRLAWERIVREAKQRRKEGEI